MPAEITMPQLSDTMSEGTVVRWLKKEGEKVREGEKIAEVETDKAVMEMEAFEGGTLALVLAKEGEKVAVGSPIAVLASSKESPAQVKQQYAGNAGAGAASIAAPSAAASTASASTSAPAVATKAAGSGAVPPAAEQGGAVATLEGASRGEMHEPANVGHGATRSAAGSNGSSNGNGRQSGSSSSPAAAPAESNTGRIFATPLARRIAAEKKIDLAQLKGTGPGGRIIQQDVLSFVPQAQPAAQPAAPAAKAEAPPAAQPQRVSRGEKQVLPLSKMRQAIAKGLQSSKQNVPHFYVTVEVDVEELSALRVRLNGSLEKAKVRLSIGDLISKGVAVALQQHPALNAHYSDKTNEIIRFGDVHLGFAVALPEGLIVPVLRNIDQMGLKEIRTRSADLIDRARAQRLKQDEMTGATFTVSNLGTFGVSEFSAIVNPPAVAILAVASAEKKPVVRGDQIVPRTMMKLTLSADHRAVDGATAADFLRTLKGLLEEPGLMLA